MARLLAIDYGKKRCGIAVTDELQIIATALKTIDTPELMVYLKKYFEQEKVEKVIIGLPKNLNNTATDATHLVHGFIKVFKKEFTEIPIETCDERFTSKMAFDTLLQSGIKKMERRNKPLIDVTSAVIILQGYMQQSSNS